MNKDIKYYVTLKKKNARWVVVGICRLQGQVLKILVVAFFNFAIS